MGYAIIDLNASYKGTRRVAQVTPTKPTSVINNTLTDVLFSYGDLVNNTLDINSVTLLPANTTAKYTFETAERTGVSIDNLTGRIILSSGFTGGDLLVQAKDGSGVVRGSYVITGLSIVSGDTFDNLTITKFSYGSVSASGGTCSPTLNYKYTKNGEEFRNGSDVTITYTFVEQNIPEDVQLNYRNVPGTVNFGPYEDTVNDREYHVLVSILFADGTGTAETETASVLQQKAGVPVEVHNISLSEKSVGIGIDTNTSNVYNIQKEGVGALSVRIEGTNSNLFNASINLDETELTITTTSRNTSGGNYTATVIVSGNSTAAGGEVISASLNVSLPYATYYITGVTYPGAPVQTETEGIFKINPQISLSGLTNKYSSLVEYNRIPGAEQYTISASKSPASYGTGVIDPTTGAMIFDINTSGMLYVTEGNISYNTSNSSHSVNISYGPYTYAADIYDFSDSSTWNTTSVGNLVIGPSHNDTGIQDYSTTYKKASSAKDRHIDFSDLTETGKSTPIGTVNVGDIIYVEVIPTAAGEEIIASTGHIPSSFTIVEGNKTLSTLQSSASTSVSRIFLLYIGTGDRTMVHVALNSSTHLHLFLYDAVNWAEGATIRYKIVRHTLG